MNRSTKGLSVVNTNLDGFSLANRRRFAKLSTYQTFPLYSIANVVLATISSIFYLNFSQCLTIALCQYFLSSKIKILCYVVTTFGRIAKALGHNSQVHVHSYRDS